jgi:hypothetical protein
MSDGRFSDKPLRSSLSREELRSAGAYSEKVDLSSDDTAAFLHSPAVQRELRALLEPLAQEIWAANSAPLHRRTPPAARNLGQPLASAALVQEYLIGLVFLRVAGWTFMFFGGLFMLAAMGLLIGITFGEGREPILAAFMVGAIGLGIAAVGAWFGIIRGRVITEMCWFCPRGMIWMTNSVFDWFPWEDVRDVYCNLNADRPAIGISFGRNVSWISSSISSRRRPPRAPRHFCSTSPRAKRCASARGGCRGSRSVKGTMKSSGKMSLTWNPPGASFASCITTAT